jgi:hypothetical protein
MHTCIFVVDKVLRLNGICKLKKKNTLMCYPPICLVNRLNSTTTNFYSLYIKLLNGWYETKKACSVLSGTDIYLFIYACMYVCTCVCFYSILIQIQKAYFKYIINIYVHIYALLFKHSAHISVSAHINSFHSFKL